MILVTGGSGFIGSHLVRTLSAKGEDVRILDLREPDFKLSNVEFIEGDIRNANDVEKAMRGCDIVFHLAAMTDVRWGMKNPDEEYKVNVLGSRLVLENAKSAKAKIIYTSSAAVYGDATVPIKETTGTKPLSNYGVSKMKVEKLCEKICPGSFIVRIFNAYGPNGHSVINKFCERILRDQEIQVFGSGRQTRDYIYVSDIINALMLGMDKDNSGIYNVGTGIETTLTDVIMVIQDLLGKQAKVSFKQEIPGEIRKSCSDISKIRSLGWKPYVELREGIEKILVSTK